MALYELRPIVLPGHSAGGPSGPKLVASVVEATRYKAGLFSREPPSPSRPSDEWVSDVWVVEENSAQDVLQVQCNVSFIQRQLGASSADTVKEVRRLTLAAFGVIGATACHRILKDRYARRVHQADCCLRRPRCGRPHDSRSGRSLLYKTLCKILA
jgi:hypothetical protein